jgi:succinate dehydrogenase / fumarate reductase cytochrome b subunit
VILLLFVLYHLADLTFGWANPDFVPGDVYHNVVAGFSGWRVSALYIVGQIALAFHLYHGLWSLFQSLGWNHPAYNGWRRRFAATFALVVVAGNLSFPLAVLSGLVS